MASLLQDCAGGASLGCDGPALQPARRAGRPAPPDASVATGGRHGAGLGSTEPSPVPLATPFHAHRRPEPTAPCSLLSMGRLPHTHTHTHTPSRHHSLCPYKTTTALGLDPGHRGPPLALLAMMTHSAPSLLRPFVSGHSYHQGATCFFCLHQSHRHHSSSDKKYPYSHSLSLQHPSTLFKLRQVLSFFSASVSPCLT